MTEINVVQCRCIIIYIPVETALRNSIALRRVAAGVRHRSSRLEVREKELEKNYWNHCALGCYRPRN